MKAKDPRDISNIRGMTFKILDNSDLIEIFWQGGYQDDVGSWKFPLQKLLSYL
jgi:hypothetical protein